MLTVGRLAKWRHDFNVKRIPERAVSYWPHGVAESGSGLGMAATAATWLAGGTTTGREGVGPDRAADRRIGQAARTDIGTKGESMKRRLLAVVAVAVIGVGSIGTAQQAASKPQVPYPATYSADQKSALKDVTVLHVYVSDIPELSGRLEPATLKTGAELRLRQIGITVIPFDTRSGTFEPDLDVLVNVLKGTGSQTGIVVYEIRVRLQRAVDVLRVQDNVMTFSAVHPLMTATVWEHSVVGYVGEQHVESIRQAVDDEVSEFLNQWLEMNPKKK